jgi:hypothetical protein
MVPRFQGCLGLVCQRQMALRAAEETVARVLGKIY